MATATEPTWWTPRQLAERWQVHVSTIHRMHQDGPGFGVMIRGQLRVHVGTVQQVEGAGRKALKAKARDEQHAGAVRELRRHRRRRYQPEADPSAPHMRPGFFS